MSAFMPFPPTSLSLVLLMLVMLQGQRQGRMHGLLAQVHRTNAFGSESKTKDIRLWGCNLTISPFIFVHIGKSGGGDARMRLAAGSANFDPVKKNAWKKVPKGQALKILIYPIHDEDASTFSTNETSYVTSKPRAARLWNSATPHFYPEFFKTFEGTWPCTAQTPVGAMLSCHTNYSHMASMCAGEHCDAVLMGHNLLGSEIHWLSDGFLQKWLHRQDHLYTCNMIAHRESLRYRRNVEDWFTTAENNSKFADGVGRRWHTIKYGKHSIQNDWSSFYASLPVARSTVIRTIFMAA